jgi:outer membrane protein OmpA-like peptidoglycan-associated protein
MSTSSARGAGLVLAGAALLVTACATPRPPAELEAARVAYQQARVGPAAAYAPAQLVDAQRALDRAERAFLEHPEALGTRDVAYIATRQAQIADAEGAVKQYDVARIRAEQEYARVAAGELGRARQQLEQEREQRQAAEARARQALENLARLADVKQAPRGVVVTLQGGLFFASGEAALLPGATPRLDELANAILAQGRTVLVEGHTDSRGSDETNQLLGARRAEAVRQYLIGKGVDAATVRAVGIGAGRPIADNGTAEGRAMNRRVEVILEEPK